MKQHRRPNDDAGTPSAHGRSPPGCMQPVHLAGRAASRGRRGALPCWKAGVTVSRARLIVWLRETGASGFWCCQRGLCLACVCEHACRPAGVGGRVAGVQGTDGSQSQADRCANHSCRRERTPGRRRRPQGQARRQVDRFGAGAVRSAGALRWRCGAQEGYEGRSDSGSNGGRRQGEREKEEEEKGNTSRRRGHRGP